MTDLTTAFSALPRASRQQARTTAQADRPDLIGIVSRMLSWIWLQYRRREIILALKRVDDHLLRDAGIDRNNIEEYVDTLLAQWR